METLATIVFERTPAGAVAIKAAGDAVPRQLRTLLLAIDGRSPVSQYVPFLTALAPLSEKFAQLESMGFARRKDTPAAATPTQTATLTEQDLLALAQNMGSSTASAPTATLDPFEAQLQALARESARLAALTNSTASPSVPPRAAAPAPPHNSTPQPQLRDLLNEMQAFLSQAAGMEGLPVALMLEQITSLAQLRQELPAYGELVTSYGVDAGNHLRQLADMLTRADA